MSEDFPRYNRLYEGGSRLNEETTKLLNDIFERKKNKVEVLVGVSHYAVVKYYPSHFGTKYLHAEKRFPFPGKSEAADVDLISGECEILSPFN